MYQGNGYTAPEILPLRLSRKSLTVHATARSVLGLPGNKTFCGRRIHDWVASGLRAWGEYEYDCKTCEKLSRAQVTTS